MTRLWPKGQGVEIWSGGETPTGFVWQGAPHCVLEICNRWRVHTRWWEPDEVVWREYIKVTTDTGLLCLLYQDLPGKGWFLARVYD
jgi:hypothetical protein